MHKRVPNFAVSELFPIDATFIMISLDGDNTQGIVQVATRLCWQMAIHFIRNRAHRDGLDKKPFGDTKFSIKVHVQNEKVDVNGFPRNQHIFPQILQIHKWSPTECEQTFILILT